MHDCLGECFGPLATMFTFDDPEDAVRMANQAPGMLQTYVFGHDTAQASALGGKLNAGLVGRRSVVLCWQQRGGSALTWLCRAGHGERCRVRV